jgi:hypothetical protein
MSNLRAVILTKRFVAGCIFSSCLFLFPHVAQSAITNSATVQWDANSEPDLAGYRIYHGIAPGIYGTPQTVGKTTTHQYTNLAAGKTYYFALTAYDTSGNESSPSTEVSKYITDSSTSAPPAPLPRNGWVVWVDSEEPRDNFRGTNAIDGNPSTIWHTHYSGGHVPPPPHSLMVDLGAIATIEGFRALPRQDTSANGQIGNYEFYVKTNSEKPPTTPPVAGEWKRVTSGTFPNTKNEQQVLFGAVSSRYVWLRALSEAQGKNNPWTSLAEFNVLGTFNSGSLPQGNPSTASTNFFWRNMNTGEVAVWLMNGMSITSVGFPGSTSLDWKIERTGDMNGDGKADLLWRNTNNGMVAVWLMNEGAILSSGFLSGVPLEWAVKGIGDVNGDGKADIIWRNTTTGMVAIWLMNGLTVTSVGHLGSTPMAWKIQHVGDVNGDGKADLVWLNQTNGTVAVWMLNGLTVASAEFPGSAPTDWRIEQVGDVNGDGKADLLWRNTNNGVVAVWLMNGKAVLSSGFLGGVPLNWEMTKVRDINGNGRGDVVFQNKANGLVAIWLMNGLNRDSVGYPGSTSTNWKMQR